MSRHPWESSYPHGVFWDTPAPVLPVESHLAAAAARWPERTALEFCGRTLSFRALHDIAARAAKGFQDLGVGPDVNVGLHLANTPHFVICFFAVLMAGGRVVPFSPHAAKLDLEYQVRDADIRIMVTLGSMKFYPQIADLNRGGLLNKVIVCRGDDFVTPEVAAALDDPPIERAAEAGDDIDFVALIANDGAYRVLPRGWLEDEVAVLQYTGGTTGEPKGAMLTHANFSVVTHSIGRWVGARMSECSSMLVALPLCHVFGLIIALLAVARGTTEMILCGGNNIFPRKIEDAIYEHPAVAEVAVIGVSDARLGQRPKAFITLKEEIARPARSGRGPDVRSSSRRAVAAAGRFRAGISVWMR